LLSVISAVFEIVSKRIGVMSLTFRGHVTSLVTWPFDSHRLFPTGGPLEPSLYLWRFLWRYSMANATQWL